MDLELFEKVCNSALCKVTHLYKFILQNKRKKVYCVKIKNVSVINEGVLLDFKK